MRCREKVKRVLFRLVRVYDSCFCGAFCG